MPENADAAPRAVGVVGGGPAGLSAALWLKNLGFAPWIAEANPRPGGMQNLNFLANDWVLGHVGLTGPELTERFLAHVEHAGIELLRGCAPREIAGGLGRLRVTLATADGATRVAACAALVIATGTRFRGAEVLAGVPGVETVPAGRLVFGPYAFADLAACAGRRVLIVGGGDNAFENARLLAARGARVDMALRSPPRAQRHLREQVARAEAAGVCRIHHAARVAALRAEADGVAVELRVAGAPLTLTVDRLHVLAGYAPNDGCVAALAEDLRAGIDRDAAGYLRVDAQARTGASGIYAAGDICNPVFPSVVSAIAQGALAAKTIELDLRTQA